MKIPEKAKRVFEGVIFDVYQWKQKMFDGSLATYEALKRSHTVQVIATQGEKILMGWEEQPLIEPAFSFFSGKGEDGEEPLETAKRELLEETGLESQDWELIFTVEPYHKLEWTIYTFVAKNCQKIQEPSLEPGEKIEIKEMDFNDFIEKVTGENFWGREFSNHILRMQKSPEKLEELKKIILK